MKKLSSQKWFVYCISIVVFIFSVLLTYFLPVTEAFKNFAIIPAICALCLPLYKSWKDGQLQNKQQDFILATASHMAEVAYDKHVLFCEEYIDKLQAGLQQIYREGASKKLINVSRELSEIRLKHSAWITKKIEEELQPIESAFAEIGANEHLLDHLDAGEQRGRTVERIYELLGLILGDKKDENSKIAIEDVVEVIRGILGINALTQLRLEATNLAVQRLK